MPPSLSAADRHRRTRRDHASETAEDYVEAIADITRAAGVCRGIDLARRFAVSHVTVSRIIARLAELGLVESEPYRSVRLTAAGLRLARRSRRRLRSTARRGRAHERLTAPTSPSRTG